MCHSGLGLLFGFIGLVLLFKIARGHRRHAHDAYGGYSGGHCGGRGRWDHRHHERGDGREQREERGGGFGKRFVLRSLFERLDTTPGQEKVIARAFDEIKEALSSARGDWNASKVRMADALRGTEFDHEAVGDAWAKHDTAFEAMRLKIATSMQEVHEALDDKQRKILADLIERGGPFSAFGGQL
jgi:hypothetical protein